MLEKCADCQKLGRECNGGNLIVLSAFELVSWCKLRKDYMRISNAKIAELSNVPKGTVDRLLAGEHLDYRYESIRPIVNVLIGGSTASENCIANTSKMAEEEIIRLQNENSHIKQQLYEDRKKYNENEKYMKQQLKAKNFAAVTSGLVLVIVLMSIISMLVVDITNSKLGFFWIN